jgi:F0F1-type ATP synthase assembly protein I
MPEDESGPFLSRSLQFLQENLRRSGPAVVAGYTLIGAIGMFGGLGYALDAWQGIAPWGLVGGLLLGVVVGFYELAKVVWHR